jgi:ABC-type transport system substrate-binding protein
MEAFGGSAVDASFRFNFDYAEYGGYISTTFFGEIGENELGIAPLQGSPMDPHNNFFTIFHPTSGRHNWGPRGNEGLPDNSPAGDQVLLDLWDAQAAELDFEKRVEIVRDIQRNMAESMYLIPWPGLSNVSIYLPHVKNVSHTTRGYGAGVETLADVWLDTA